MGIRIATFGMGKGLEKVPIPKSLGGETTETIVEGAAGVGSEAAENALVK